MYSPLLFLPPSFLPSFSFPPSPQKFAPLPPSPPPPLRPIPPSLFSSLQIPRTVSHISHRVPRPPRLESRQNIGADSIPFPTEFPSLLVFPSVARRRFDGRILLKRRHSAVSMATAAHQATSLRTPCRASDFR